MAWIEKARIEGGVLNMLQVNLGVRPGEKVVVITDPPSLARWREVASPEVELALERGLLAKAVSEIAAEKLAGCQVEFYAYPMTARSGAEPVPEVGEKMKAADVVIAITNHSLSHTDARQKASEAGARIASMPGFLTRMFYPEGPMAADYQEVARRAKPMAELLTRAKTATVCSPGGTDLTFSLAGREGREDNGLLTAKGSFGNLPAGEAYIAPLEGTAEGKLVVEPGWARGLTEKMVLTFHQGLVVEVQSGGTVGDHLRDLLGLVEGQTPHPQRRNLAELGIGCNPKARSV